jgi:ribosome-binding protein aMBF1 (putative translation factor)
MLDNGYYDYIYVIEGGRKCCHMVMLSASVIVEARRRAGLSQRELALRLGKRQAEIARWERGHVVPSPPVPRSACGRPGARVLGMELRRASLDATEFVGQWCVK